MDNVTVVPRQHKSPFVKALRCARYLRVSTHEQILGYGIEAQDDGTLRLVHERGWIDAGAYTDAGVSGTLIDRPHMLRLERDAQAGLIDVIVVHKTDRIGRVGRAFWSWVWRMEDLGVRFVSATQAFDTTTPQGMQQLQFYAMFAESEWNLIRERTQNGQQLNAQNGRWNGGPPPYGYLLKSVGKRGSVLDVDPEEALLISMIAALIIDQHKNIGQVCAELNMLGYQTRSGGPWKPGNLHARLRSGAAFTGQYVFRNPNKHHRNGTVLDSDGQPVHGDTVIVQVPEILTEQRREDLRAALALNAIGPRPEFATYPLSGRITAQCGRTFIGAWNQHLKTRYYHCPGGKDCEDVQLNADVLDEAVWDAVVDVFQDDELMRKMVLDWTAKLPANTVQHDERVAQLVKAVASKEALLQKAVVEYVTLNVDPRFKEAAVKELQEDLKKTQELLNHARSIQADYEAAKTNIESLVDLVDVAREGLRDLDPTEQRRVVSILNVRVAQLGNFRGRKGGVQCRVRRWHGESGALVPSEITEAEWPRIEEFIRTRNSVHDVRWENDPRRQINAIIYYLRELSRWADLPEEYGTITSAQDRLKRWWKNGTWKDLLEFLADRPGAASAYQLPAMPAVEVSLTLLPELVVREVIGASSTEDRVSQPNMVFVRERSSRRARNHEDHVGVRFVIHVDQGGRSSVRADQLSVITNERSTGVAQQAA